MHRLFPRTRISLHRFKRAAARLCSLDSLFLLLLSASFGYSLFSLIVQIVDSETDFHTVAQISPDGKSLLQVRTTGLAIFDVQSGKLVDELRLIGRWRNAFMPHEKRTDLWTRGDSSVLPFLETTDLRVSSNAQIVVVRCLDDTLLWWNRSTKQHQVIDSPDFFWSDINLDEPRDRFYVETLQGYNAGEEPAKADMSGRYAPFALNEICDMHVFELSSGNKIKTFQSLLIGQPVRGRPELRVRAQEEAIELLRWPSFPEGEPTVQNRFPLDAIAVEQLKYSVPPFIRLKESDLVLETIISPHHSSEDKPFQVRTLRLSQGNANSSTRNLYSSLTQVEIFDQLEGYAASDYMDKNRQPIWRIELVMGDKRALLNNPTKSVLQYLRADYGLSAAKLSQKKIRLSRDDGAIFDIDLTAPDKTAAWKIPLQPHHQVPRDAIVVFLAGALLWLAYAYKSRCIVAKQGWVVLTAVVTWPLLLGALELGFTNVEFADIMQLMVLTTAFVPLAACSLGLILKKGRLRALALVPWIVLAMMAAGAISTINDRESATFLDHFGIRLSWRNEQ
jgi:hypothetical protein